MLKVKKADIKAQNNHYEKEWIENIEKTENLIDEVLTEQVCFSLKDLDIDGNDLIDIGYEPGKRIGEILNVLLQKVIDDEVKNSKEDLLNLVKEMF